MGHSTDDRSEADQRLVLLSKIDILADLSESEMNRIVDAARARTYRAGELLYTPHRQVEVLFLLKRGRIRVFRVSPDGRTLTTAIGEPGTMFGEMVLLGQRMYDNYAEPSTRRTRVSWTAPTRTGCCGRIRVLPRAS